MVYYASLLLHQFSVNVLCMQRLLSLLLGKILRGINFNAFCIVDKPCSVYLVLVKRLVFFPAALTL